MIQSNQNSYWLAQKICLKTFCNVAKMGIKVVLKIGSTGKQSKLVLEVVCQRSLLNTGQTYRREGDNISSCWLQSNTDGRRNDDCHKI